MDRRDYLKEGLGNSYAILYVNFGTKAMQSQLKEHPNFKKMYEDKPI